MLRRPMIDWAAMKNWRFWASRKAFSEAFAKARIEVVKTESIIHSVVHHQRGDHSCNLSL